MSDTSPAHKRRLDPLLLPLFAAGAELVLALAWPHQQAAPAHVLISTTFRGSYLLWLM